MGNISEVRYMVREAVPRIQKISADDYVVLSTGEVKQFDNNAVTRADNLHSVSQSLARLRDLINTNVTSLFKCRWVTLTYAENMKDEKRLYEDFRRFWLRFKYYLDKNGLSPCNYIACAEPQARGSWHLHVIFVFAKKAPFIPNEQLARIWRQGFTKINSLSGVDNVGLYLTAYLTDMELSEAIENGAVDITTDRIIIKNDDGDGKRSKAIVKGERMKLYPAGFRIYRASGGIKQPTYEDCTEEEAMQRIGSAKLVYEKTIKIINDEQDFVNIINYRQFNSRAKKGG